MKTLLPLIISFLFISSCHAKSKHQQGWESDIETLKQELPKKHIHPLFHTSMDDFEKA